MNELPKPHQCHKCKEWFHTVHVCASDVKLMPVGCTTPSGCKQHGCHGACLQAAQAAQPAQVPDTSCLNDYVDKTIRAHMAKLKEAGYVLVPVEPTESMLNAASHISVCREDVYRAMVAVAPSAAPSTKEQSNA